MIIVVIALAEFVLKLFETAYIFIESFVLLTVNMNIVLVAKHFITFSLLYVKEA